MATSFATAALARNVSEGHDMRDPTMILLSGGSLASAYANHAYASAHVTVDADAAPVSSSRPTVPARRTA